jgi:hypothetical protein
VAQSVNQWQPAGIKQNGSVPWSYNANNEPISFTDSRDANKNRYFAILGYRSSALSARETSVCLRKARIICTRILASDVRDIYISSLLVNFRKAKRRSLQSYTVGHADAARTCVSRRAVSR